MKLYHYTVASKLPLILADRALKPTTVNRGPKERPILWWSTNSVWEPTAAKGNGLGGTHNFETHRDVIGLCRFVMAAPTAHVYPWPQIGEKANMSPLVRTRLEERGRAVGATPSHWWGTLRPIPIADLQFDVCTEAAKWELLF